MHRIWSAMETEKPDAPDTDSSTPTDAAAEPGFAVRDRRWWVEAESQDGQDGDAGEPEPSKPSFVAALEKQLEELRQVADEARSRQRAAIDEFERAKRRIERDAAREQESRHRSVLASFLPVLDDLDRALAAARESADVQAIVEGVGLVRNTLMAKLEEQGVTIIQAAGAAFDPAVHEAVATQPVDDPALDNQVIAVQREGYAIGDAVLRAPLVVVGKQPRGRS